MKAKESGRRRFLKEGAVLAGLVVGGIRSASGHTLEIEDRLGVAKRSAFETAVRVASGYAPGYWLTPIQDSRGIITPSDLHFTKSPSDGIPEIDPSEHRLLIHGLVDRPLIFTLAELMRLPSVSRIYFLECIGNSERSAWRWKEANTVQYTHGRTSCSEWTGVPLSLLLREAGLQKGAGWLVTDGAEPSKWMRSIPLEKAMDDVLVAYGQNGEMLRPEQGYPLRLVIPGWRGGASVKWLRQIKAVDQPYMSRIESGRGKVTLTGPNENGRWIEQELKVKSVITFPSGGQRLSGPGFYEITGLAWSAGGAIRRVEVSTDGGRTWKDAQLQEPVLRFAHTRFRLAWNWDGEEAVLQSRSTDERGDVQPSLAEISKRDGLTLDHWRSHPNRTEWDGKGPFNPIQPWKVTREGRVLNAL